MSRGLNGGRGRMTGLLGAVERRGSQARGGCPCCQGTEGCHGGCVRFGLEGKAYENGQGNGHGTHEVKEHVVLACWDLTSGTRLSPPAVLGNSAKHAKVCRSSVETSSGRAIAWKA